MRVKEGIVPTILGTAVTAAGLALRDNIPDTYRGGIIGFGLAHIVLGSMDIVDNKQNNVMKKINRGINRAVDEIKG